VPEGEWNFLEQKGPRKLLQLRITPEADATLRVVAAQTGTTKHALATRLVEEWAVEQLDKSEESS
jgi:hypothetical protein